MTGSAAALRTQWLGPLPRRTAPWWRWLRLWAIVGLLMTLLSFGFGAVGWSDWPGWVALATGVGVLLAADRIPTRSDPGEFHLLAGLMAVAVAWMGWLALAMSRQVGGGGGLPHEALGVIALLLMLVMVAASATAALGVLVATLAWVALLPSGWIGIAPGGGARLAAAELALILGLAVASARTAAGQWRARLRASEGRARGVQGLLAIATFLRWESDEMLMLRRVERRSVHGRFEPEPLDGAAGHWRAASQRERRRLMLAMARRWPLQDIAVEWVDPREQGVRQLAVSGTPRFNAAGRFIGYWGVARDVTDEKLAQQARAASESRYRQLFLSTPVALILHHDGRIVDANPAAMQLFGYAHLTDALGRDLVAEHVLEGYQAESRHRIELISLNEPGVPLPPIQRVMKTTHGKLVFVKTTGVRAQLPGGRDGTLSMYVDETEQRATGRALQDSEALFRTVVSMTPTFITLSELASGRLVFANESWARMLRLRPELINGRTLEELGLVFTLGSLQDIVDAARMPEGAGSVRVAIRSADGRNFALSCSAVVVDYQGKECLLASWHDQTTTERLEMERQAILDNASIGIALTRDRRIVLANHHLAQLLGRPDAELLGQAWGGLLRSERLDDRLGPLQGAAVRGEAVTVEQPFERVDGRRGLLRMTGKAVSLRPEGDDGADDIIWIVQDITAQREAEDELARARDLAEAANRTKSSFLATTSHEIRTPLNALVGLARLARQPQTDAQQLRNYLDQIAESAEALTSLIQDILDLSKIEAGKFVVVREPFDLEALMRGLAQGYGALATERGLQFELRVDAGLPQRVDGDALRVRQVLVNLLHNAFKFTEQGSISLVARAHPRPQWLRFEVTDTGPGLSEDARAMLFEPFTQVDQSITRQHGGTGLGLSICRELVRLMGGNIGVESTLGLGSRFHVELPLAPSVEAAPAASAAADLGAALRGLRVLLVEDNPVNMMIGVAILQQWGVDVAQAVDGRQALAAVLRAESSQQPFDAVLMDVQMPGMSGYQVTEALRARRDDRMPPIIALTAAALGAERERAIACGMDEFLTKPIDQPQLRDALLRAAERSRSAAAQAAIARSAAS